MPFALGEAIPERAQRECNCPDWVLRCSHDDGMVAVWLGDASLDERYTEVAGLYVNRNEPAPRKRYALLCMAGMMQDSARRDGLRPRPDCFYNDLEQAVRRFDAEVAALREAPL
jgi:hypothetical protein